MKEKEDNLKYISLQEATKFCPYSQKYLNLRVRQGKLKAIKLGRNWLTKKEWLEDYQKKVEEYKEQIGVKKSEGLRFLTKFSARKLRPAFAIAMLFILIISGVVFGKVGFGNIFPAVKETISSVFENLNLATAEIRERPTQVIVDFFSWVGNSIKKIPQSIVNLFKKETPAQPVVNIPPEQTTIPPDQTVKEIEELKTQIQELKQSQPKETTKEPSSVTQVEPIKQITYQTIVNRIDDASLKILNIKIADLQTELTKRLYAPGGVISQQIYLTQPIASPKIYQENGDIVLQAAGSGNVMLSAATGMQISGSQVVIDSTSLIDPLVYIADRTKIAGKTDIMGDLTTQAITGTSLTLTGTISGIGDITTTGQLGVGTASPTEMLTVLGSSTTPLLGVYSSSSAPALYVDAEGNVGIGTASPLAPLDVRGPIEEGLIGWWSFDEGTGTTTTDQSINDNTGILGSTTVADDGDPTWVTGKFGNALNFDGVDDYVNINNSSEYLFGSGDSFTLSAWVRTDSFGTYRNILRIHKGGYTDENVWLFRYTNNNKLQLAFGNTNATFHISNSNRSITDTNWHYAVGIVNAVQHKVYLYIDGKLEAEDTDSSSAWRTDADVLRIGCVGYTAGPYPGVFAEFFDGLIDEVSIYNRALSKREINEHYRQKAPSLAQGGTVSGDLYVLNGNVAIGTTTPIGNFTLQQVNNGDTMFLGVRKTDTAPSGDFIKYQTVSGTDLFRIDNSGNYTGGGIISSGALTVTSSSTPQFRTQYDSSNEMTVTVSSGGTTTIAVNAPSSPSLFFTPQSNSTNTFSFTDASENSILSIDTSSGYVGIGTTSPNNLIQVANLINFDDSKSGTFIGYQSGYSNTGSVNSFFGYQAGVSNTSAQGNSFLGTQAGYSNTIGNYNTFVGYGAGYDNSTGTNNSFVGVVTGRYNTTGSYNSFMGSRAGYEVTTGSNNLLFGWQAGDNLTTGSNNIIVGYDIDTPAVDTSNFLNIGNLIFATGINGTGTAISSGNVGIGTTSPETILTVAGGNADNGIRSYGVIQSYLSPSDALSGGVQVVNANANPAVFASMWLYSSIAGGTAYGLDRNNMFALTTNGVSSMVVGTNGIANLHLFTNQTVRMTLDTSGNVGIGTTSPSEKLTVAGGNILQTPGTPVAIGGVDLAVSAQSVYISGRYAYVIKTTNAGTCSGTDLTGCEFSIYDVSNPSSPAPVGGVDTGRGLSVYVSGRYAYVGKTTNAGTCSGTDLTGCEFSIYDVSNPSSPAPVGGVNLAQYGFGVYVSGRYAYVMKDTDAGTCSGTDLTGCEFSIYDVSNPSSPAPVGGADLDIASYGFYVSGRYAYLVKNPDAGTCSGTTLTGCEFSIYDISNPASPAPVGGVNLADGAYGVYVSGRYAYVTKAANAGTCSGTDLTGCEFSIYDISNPASPAPVGGADLADTLGAKVYVSGRYAYMIKQNNAGTCSGTTLTGCEFSIYDVSNPSSPAPVGGADTGGGSNVYVSGRYAYVTKDANAGTCSGTTLTGCELSIFDISGIEVSSGMIHSLETGNLQVRNDILAQGQLQVTGGINVGSGGLFSAGAISTKDGGYFGGNVGIGTIGTTNPEVALHIYNTDGSLMLGQQNGAIANERTFRFAPSAGGLYIQAYNDAGAWQRNIMMLSHSSGSVGIGTSSPLALLEVFSDSSGANGLLRVATGTTEGLYVDNSGNVGIGTTSPVGTLHVNSTYGTISTGNKLVVGDGQYYSGGEPSSNLGPWLRIGEIGTFAGRGGNEDAGLEFLVTRVNGGGYGWLVGAFDRGANIIPLTLKSRTNSGTWTEQVTFLNTGNVGIGTTSPSYGLELMASSTSGYFGISGSTQGDVMVIDANGYVGIGTTTPGQKLTVQGNISLTGNLLPLNANQSVGSAGVRIYNGWFENLDVTNMTIASSSISGTVSQSFTINSDNATDDTEGSDLVFSRGIAAPSALLTWNSTSDRFEFNFPTYIDTSASSYFGGNVGIGTTSPAYGLELMASSTNGYFGISSSTQGDVMVIDANGNVGIGTTNPGAKLDLVSSDSWQPQIRLENTNADEWPSAFYIAKNSASPANGDYLGLFSFYGRKSDLTLQQRAQIWAMETDVSSTGLGAKIGFVTGGSGGYNGDVVIANGHVGIGTTTPSALLDVFSDNSSASGLFRVATGTTEGLYVDNSGNVGIGTTSPSALLNLYAPIEPLLNFSGNRTSDSDFADIGFFNRASNSLFGIYISGTRIGADNSLGFTFYTQNLGNFITAMRIYPSGNVGIGTTSPAYGLELMASSTLGYFGISSSTQGDVLTIDADGNVNVGTTTSPDPTMRLYIYNGNMRADATGGNIQSWSTISAGYSGFQAVNFDASAFVTGRLYGPTLGGTLLNDGIDRNNAYLLQGSEISSMLIGNSTSSPLYLFTDNTARVTITGAGNVGIGTTSPNVKLQVFGGQTQLEYLIINSGYYIYSADSAGNISMMGGATHEGGRIDFYGGTAPSNTGSLIFKTGTSGVSSEKMRIDSGGNVGIGTTSPAYGLELMASSTLGYFGISSSTQGDVMVIDANGNVGIGTTSPSNILHIDGTGPSDMYDAVSITSKLYNGYYNSAIKVNPLVANTSEAIDHYRGIDIRMRVGDNVNITNMQPLEVFAPSLGAGATIDNLYGIQIESMAGGTNNWQIYSVGTAPSYFAGNIGIGTSTPSALLDVFSDGSSASGLFRVATGTTEGLYVDSSGNVGIGTTTPTSAAGLARFLHISGSPHAGIVFEDTDVPSKKWEMWTNDGNFVIWNQSVGDNNIAIWPNGGGIGLADNSPDFGLELATSTTKGYFGISSLADNDGDLFIVDGTGNVGIGTTSPASLLDVYQATDTASIANFQNATGSALYVREDGKVIIGAKALEQRGGEREGTLSVSGDIRADGGTGIRSFCTASNSYCGFQVVNHDVSTFVTQRLYGPTIGGTLLTDGIDMNNAYFLQGVGNASMLIGNSASSPLYLFTGNTARVTITGSGNVGIGTTTPSALFDVYQATDTASIANFQNATGSVLYVGEDGYVGIGTTSPGAKLHISELTQGGTGVKITGSTGGEDWLQFERPNIRTWAINGGSGMFNISNVTEGGNKLSINSSGDVGIGGSITPVSLAGATLVALGTGNVGIGVTDPNSPLHVNGYEYVGATSGAFTGQAATVYYGHSRKFISNSSGVNVDGSTDWLTFAQHSGAKGFAFGTSNTDATPHDGFNPKMVIQVGGNVGIGTTSPVTLLHSYLGASGGTPYSSGITALTLENSSHAALQFLTATTSEQYIFFGAPHVSGATGARGYIMYGHATDQFYFFTSGNYSFGGGNIGIGTSTPTAGYQIDAWDAAVQGYGAYNNRASHSSLKDVIGDISVLEKLDQLNLKEWQYKSEIASSTGDYTLHFSPFADNFYQVFGLNASEWSIRDADVAGVALKGVQEIGQIIDLKSATTTFTTLTITGLGNVGIGTTSPEYKLEVVGDIAAQSFVNISTAGAKKDISFLTQAEEEEILQQIASTSIATYLYNNEEDINNTKHLGLIAEESPKEILSVSGKGIDLYKMASFLFAGIKAQGREIDKLTAEVEAIKLQLNSLGQIGPEPVGSTTFVEKVKQAIASLGLLIENGVVRVQQLFADKITTKEIQIVDKSTGEIYCTWLENGEWMKVKGECGQPQTETAPASAPVEQPVTERPPAEEIVPQPEPQPASEPASEPAPEAAAEPIPTP